MKILLPILFSIWVLIDSGAQGPSRSTITDDETYRTLSGVWNFIDGTRYKLRSYSWGTSKVLIDGSVVIDLGDPVPEIYAPQMGTLQISHVERRDGATYVINAKWKRDDGNFVGTITLELLDARHMVIYDEMKPYHFFDWSGPRHVLTKVDGPE